MSSKPRQAEVHIVQLVNGGSGTHTHMLRPALHPMVLEQGWERILLPGG